MRPDACDNKKTTWEQNFGIYGTTALWFFCLFGVASCQRHPQSARPVKPSPPDLSRCTRIEVQYRPSTLQFFFPGKEQKKLLSSDELSYLQSIDTIVVNDSKAIKALAHDVSLHSYEGPVRGTIGVYNTIHFVCYHDGERLTSFTKIGLLIETEDKQWFKYDGGWPSLAKLTPQVSPFSLRARCASNMSRLVAGFPMVNQKIEYPNASKWCDEITLERRSMDAREEDIVRRFKCPSAVDGRCHYTMNPDCTPDSLPDIVLLFETKDGWNQHGGPELFTFDNHDPKGGCVLLNDGTINFIRTKEELLQLRWK